MSISLGIVLFTAGFVFWESYSNSQPRLGDDFTAAVVLAAEEDVMPL